MSASSLPLPQGKSVSLKQFVSRHINEIGLLVVIAILYLVFSLNAPGFISLNNQMNVLRDAATIGIAAWAMTLIIISGEIDVSVGPMVAFVSVCLAFLLQFDVPLAIACLLVLLLGALMGTLAGVLRGVFNVPSFVATLGLWSALRGMGLFMTNALPVTIDENEVLDWLGTSMGGPIALKLTAHIDTPNLILFCPAAYAVSAWQLPFGNGFTENIRRENSFLETDAGIISAGYPGNVLYFIGDRDEVIPPAIDRLYNASFRQASSFRRVQIDNCPHPIHRWAASTPEVRHTIRAELSRFIDTTVPHVAPSRP